MDKREGTGENFYKKELERELHEGKSYDEYVMENGKKFRVPYKKVRQVVFNNLKKEELVDQEHAARLQYRLMLLDSVLFAKVEFATRKITLTYNPEGAENSKEKIALQGLMGFLAKEGVHAPAEGIEERDVDYYKENYSYHYNPPSIREHPPYGYTLEEWRNGMKQEYEGKKDMYDKEKSDKFHEFQREYLGEHPELATELGIKVEAEKEDKGLLGKVFKKKKAKNSEKGFWFHGV